MPLFHHAPWSRTRQLRAADVVWSDVAGKVLHLDFSDVTTLFQDATMLVAITTDGQEILGVNDLSSSNYDLTGLATAGPLYKTNIQNGKSVARFDGSNDTLSKVTGVASHSLPVWMFIVCASDDVTGVANHQLLGDDGNQGLLLTDAGSTNRWRINFGTALTSAVNITAGFHLLTGKGFGTGGSLIRVDRVEEVVGSANTGPFDTDIFLGANNAGNNPWDGDIGEVLIYDADLTDAERAAIEAYLMTKWGL